MGWIKLQCDSELKVWNKVEGGGGYVNTDDIITFSTDEIAPNETDKRREALYILYINGHPFFYNGIFSITEDFAKIKKILGL